MPIFAHEENPLNDQEWENIKAVVIDVARKRLVGRRIVDLHGPLGPGIQTIVHDHFSGTTIGRIGLLGSLNLAAGRLRHGRRERSCAPEGRSPAAHRHHGTWRHRDHPLGNAPQEEPGEPGPPMSSHHHEVRALCLGGARDALEGHTLHQ